MAIKKPHYIRPAPKTLKHSLGITSVWKCPYYENTRHYGSARGSKRALRVTFLWPHGPFTRVSPVGLQSLRTMTSASPEGLGEDTASMQSTLRLPTHDTSYVIVVHRALVFFSKGRFEKTQECLPFLCFYPLRGGYPGVAVRLAPCAWRLAFNPFFGHVFFLSM